VFQVDDLIQPGAKQIAFSFFGRIPSAATRESRPAEFEGILKIQIASFRATGLKACNLKTYLVRKIDSRSMPWQLFTDDAPFAMQQSKHCCLSEPCGGVAFYSAEPT
jgi:hypothetical protein